jgi:hypothetical protein
MEQPDFRLPLSRLIAERFVDSTPIKTRTTSDQKNRFDIQINL